jgi:ribosomal protein S20
MPLPDLKGGQTSDTETRPEVRLAIHREKTAASNTAIRTGQKIFEKLVEEGKHSEATAVFNATVEISTAILSE